MTQYWLKTPVENAREIVQRKINELGYQYYNNAIVTYDDQCEVIYYTDYLQNYEASYYDINTIYFGTFVISISGAQLGKINIEDYTVSNFSDYPPMAGKYESVIWNQLIVWNNPYTYFVGYKFKISFEEQQQPRIRFYNPFETSYGFDIGNFGDAQDDTPVSIVEENGTLTTFAINNTPGVDHIGCYNGESTTGWLEIKCNSPINYINADYFAAIDYFDIEIINCKELTTLSISSSIDIPYSSLDTLLMKLVSYGKENGTLVLPNNLYVNSYLLTAPSKVYYDTLISRGWSVTY